MKSVKKLLICLFCMVMLSGTLVGLTGCGGDKKIDKDGNVTLQYWDIFPEGDPARNYILALIEEFETANPKIKIQHTGTSFWDYFTKITVSMNDKRGPDIFMQDNITTQQRAEGGVIMELSQFMTDDTVNETDFMPEDKKSMEYKDKMYAVPWSINGRYLYYNKDHFEAAGNIPDGQVGSLAKYKVNGEVRAPQTYDEFNEYSIALTKGTRNASGVVTNVEQLGYDNALGNQSILNYIWTIGGSVFDAEGNPTVNTDDKVKKAFENWYNIARRIDSYADGQNKIRVTNSAANNFKDMSGSGSTDTAALFYSGKVSMMVATSEIPWQFDRLNEADKFNLGIASIPYEGEENRSHYSGCFTLEMTSRLNNYDPRVKEAAFKFIDFMMSHKVQSEMSLQEGLDGWLPGRNSAYQELSELYSDNAVKKFAIDEMQYRRYCEYVKNADQWWGIVTDEVAKLTADEYQNTANNRPLAEQIQAAIDETQRRIERKIATG